MLSCHDVSVTYDRRKALDAFSLSLSPGEIRVLIGPNGSGKSTALHVLAGLLKPISGRVELDGMPVDRMPRRRLAKRLAFLPQQPSAPDEITVRQLVLQGRFAHVGLLGSYGKDDEAAVIWALESTGLSGLADRGLRELSGGERQRAWIAAALTQEASILLLDEPTSFLDIGHQVEVLDLLQRLSAERGVTVVMAIHDLNQAFSVGDRISLLDKGRPAFDGRPAELAASGLIETVFRVRGRFIELNDQPHFNIDLRRAYRHETPERQRPVARP